MMLSVTLPFMVTICAATAEKMTPKQCGELAYETFTKQMRECGTLHMKVDATLKKYCNKRFLENKIEVVLAREKNQTRLWKTVWTGLNKKVKLTFADTKWELVVGRGWFGCKHTFLFDEATLKWEEKGKNHAPFEINFGTQAKKSARKYRKWHNDMLSNFSKKRGVTIDFTRMKANQWGHDVSEEVKNITVLCASRFCENQWEYNWEGRTDRITDQIKLFYDPKYDEWVLKIPQINRITLNKYTMQWENTAMYCYDITAEPSMDSEKTEDSEDSDKWQSQLLGGDNGKIQLSGSIYTGKLNNNRTIQTEHRVFNKLKEGNLEMNLAFENADYIRWETEDREAQLVYDKEQWTLKFPDVTVDGETLPVILKRNFIGGTSYWGTKDNLLEGVITFKSIVKI